MSDNSAAIKDIVCNMEVASDDISLDYQGCHYVFCSQQCLERFQLNPHLYIGYPGSESPKHAGAEVLKRRTLKLTESLPSEVIDPFVEYLEAMMGVRSVEINRNCITIVYDLLQATESQIEERITDAGVSLGTGLMEKIKRAFVHYVEETEVESLEARPSSGAGHHH